MSRTVPVPFVGFCEDCGREVRRKLPPSSNGGDYRARVRCRECETICLCSSAVEDGETPDTDMQSIRSWLLSSPDEVVCWFPEHNGASRRGEWA